MSKAKMLDYRKITFLKPVPVIFNDSVAAKIKRVERWVILFN